MIIYVVFLVYDVEYVKNYLNFVRILNIIIQEIIKIVDEVKLYFIVIFFFGIGKEIFFYIFIIICKFSLLSYLFCLLRYFIFDFIVQVINYV